MAWELGVAFFFGSFGIKTTYLCFSNIPIRFFKVHE